MDSVARGGQLWGLDLVWWLVIGLVLLAVIVLVFSLLPLLRRLPGLWQAGFRMRRRVRSLEALQDRLQTLQQRASELEPLAEQARGRVSQIKGGEPE
ncbi:MAG: hypothetical protein ACRDT8_05370 [Micromonosporaceae bacterium]